MGLKGRARFCAMSAEASGERPAKRPRAGKPPLHSVEGARREVLSDAAHRDEAGGPRDPSEGVDAADLEPASTRGLDELTPQLLAERRLFRVEKMLEMYKEQYWSLMEELRQRHAEYVQRHGQAGLKDATSPTKPARPVRDAWAASHAEGEVPTFSDGEEEVLAMEPRGAPGEEEVQEWQRAWAAQAGVAARLEQSVGAASAREMDRCQALAVLVGRRMRYFIRQSAVTLGRSGGDHVADVDLAQEGDARFVSREHVHLAMHASGAFGVRNVGRVPIYVNGQELGTDQAAGLAHLSLLEVGGLQLLFLINHGAVARARRHPGAANAPS